MWLWKWIYFLAETEPVDRVWYRCGYEKKWGCLYHDCWIWWKTCNHSMRLWWLILNAEMDIDIHESMVLGYNAIYLYLINALLSLNLSFICTCMSSMCVLYVDDFIAVLSIVSWLCTSLLVIYISLFSSLSIIYVWMASKSPTTPSCRAHLSLNQSIKLYTRCLATIIQSAPHITRNSLTTREAFDLPPTHGTPLEEGIGFLTCQAGAAGTMMWCGEIGWFWCDDWWWGCRVVVVAV